MMGSLSEESIESIDGVEEIGKHDKPSTVANQTNDVKRNEILNGSNSDLTESITPLPALGMTLMSAIQLNEAMMINVLYPFLVFMIESFGYTGTVLVRIFAALSHAFVSFNGNITANNLCFYQPTIMLYHYRCSSWCTCWIACIVFLRGSILFLNAMGSSC